MVSRTGFTGDLGYELWIDPAHALALWDALFAAGATHGIRPIGTHALEVARIEAGFIAGAAWISCRPTRRLPGPLALAVRARPRAARGLQEADFNGRRALLEEQKRGSRFRFVRLDIEGNKPAQLGLHLRPRRTAKSSARSPRRSGRRRRRRTSRSPRCTCPGAGPATSCGRRSTTSVSSSGRA